MPGAREGRHRSRLRPSEALDPQGTPGPLSRVRERVGVRAANTTFQNQIRSTQAATIAVSSGEVVVLRVAIGVPFRYGRGYGLGREGLYTARSGRSLTTTADPVWTFAGSGSQWQVKSRVGGQLLLLSEHLGLSGHSPGVLNRP